MTRVLQVVTYMGRGGLETMLMNYYRQIDRSRLQFDFLVHRDFRADYDDEIESMGGIISRLPPLNPFSLRYRSSLDRFFGDHPDYRIVHSHLDCMAGIPLKAAKKHEVPVRIAHAHNNTQDKDKKYWIKMLYKRSIAAQATQLFACGQAAGQWMFGGAPFQVLNNAIDAADYRYTEERAGEVRRRLGISPETFVLGHVGNFVPAKNHMFLLEIFARVAQRNPDSLLLLAGGGGLMDQAKNQCRSLGVGEQVKFLGVRSDIPDVTQAMDVFVFPSLHEGLPVALVEAQAAGLPCFISDRVPPECRKTALVTQVALEAGADVWAERILAVRGAPRRDAYQEIVQSGFDIKDSAVQLQRFYLEQWEAWGTMERRH